MIRYFLKRLLWAVPTILAVSLIVYWAMDLTPVDPANLLLGDSATEEEYEAVREQMGLNDPLIVRYLRYISGVLHGDMGTSLYGGKNVWNEVMGRLPNTVSLAVASVLITMVLAIPLGIIAALKQNTWIDTVSSAVSFIGMAIPNFWLGIMLIMLFSVKLGWLPGMGAGEGLKSLILPAITVGTGNVASLTRTVRAAMLDVLRQDYLRTARSKGLSRRVVTLKHALKNAMIPIVTIIGTNMAGLLAGAMVTETVFSWPGLGYLTVQSVMQGDYNMVTGCIIITAVLMSVVLIVMDMAYALIDPRIKAQYTRR